MTKVTPYLYYADCGAALDFLRRAFGFEETLRYTEPDGRVSHAEARLGDAHVMLGDPGEDYRNPRQLGGATAGIHVLLDGGVDELCIRARAAGAEIVREPADQPYGERQFSAEDPEGQHWFFAQTIREVAPEDWGANASSDPGS